MTPQTPKHEIIKMCKNCGAQVKGRGTYTYHRSGIISFNVHNMEADCIYCSPKYKKQRETW